MPESRDLQHPPVSVAGRLGDRLAGFAVLLPAEPTGPVLLCVSDAVGAALRAHFPGALDVDVDAAVDAEGSTGLPAPGTVGLLVLDTRVADGPRRTALLDTVAPDGVVATIGVAGEHVVYPGTEHPEHVWRRGWPMPAMPGPREQLRREAGLRSAHRRGVPHLEVSGAVQASLADRIAEDLGHALGGRWRLLGVVTGVRTILRYRGSAGEDDVAVRVAGTDPWAELTPADPVLAEIPALAELLPAELARGCTAGRPWVATRWVRARRTGLLNARRTARRAPAVLDALLDVLAAAPTGRITAGWADRWVAAVDLVPPARRPVLADALRVLETDAGAGLPTGWCHGDPWVANVLVEGRGGAVVDWDNAVRDAPLGLDRLLVAMHTRAARERLTLAGAAATLVDDDRVDAVVAGAAWHSWDTGTRTALLVAAHLLYLRNRSSHDLAPGELEAELDLLVRMATTASSPATTVVPAVRGRGSRGGPVSGAGWLGLGAGVVKAAQTVVLLVLAALLAPSAIGVLSIGALVLNVTSAITDLGSSTALVHWRGDAERAARSALTLGLSLALSLTGLAWLAAPALSAALHAGDLGTDVVRGLMLCLPFYAVSGVSQELLRRELAFRRRVVPDIVGALIGAVLSVVLAVAGMGALSLVAGQLVQAVVVMVLCWLMRRPVRPGWRRSDAGGLVAYGGHLALANIVGLVMLNVDYLVVARYLGPEPLGIYSMAFRLAYMPYLLVAVVICGAAFAHLCRLAGDRVGRAVADVGVTIATAVVPLYLGMILLAPQLELLGPTWAPGVPALRWLAGYGAVLSIVQVCLVTLNAVSRTRDTFLLNLLHLLVLTALLLVLADRGIVVVAVAQLLAGAAMLLLAARCVRRRVTGFAWRALAARLGPVLGGAALMTATVLLAQQLLPWTRVSVPGLLLVGTLALAAYAAPVVLGNGGLRPLLGAEGRR